MPLVPAPAPAEVARSQLARSAGKTAAVADACRTLPSDLPRASRWQGLLPRVTLVAAASAVRPGGDRREVWLLVTFPVGRARSRGAQAQQMAADRLRRRAALSVELLPPIARRAGRRGSGRVASRGAGELGRQSMTLSHIVVLLVCLDPAADPRVAAVAAAAPRPSRPRRAAPPIRGRIPATRPTPPRCCGP